MAKSGSLLKLMCVIAAALAVVCPSAHAQLHQPLLLHVDDDAAPGGDGASWATAYNNLQAALDHIRAHPDPDGHLIRIAEGTYRPFALGQAPRAFAIPSHTTILGGHLPVWGNPRDPVGTPTIITGDIKGDDTPQGANTSDNANTVIGCWDEASLPTIVLTTDVVLDGLTIERGGNGADLLVAGGATTLRGCATRRNYGSMALRADTVVEDCTFTNNYSRVFSVVAKNGLGQDTGQVFTISRCAFTSNGTSLDAATRLDGTAAFRIEGATLHAMDCTFSDHDSKPTVLVRLEDGATPAPGVTHDHVLERCVFERTSAPVFHNYFRGYRQFLILTDCRFVETAADFFYSDNAVGIDATRCEFTRNGRIMRPRQASRFRECTFTDSAIEIIGDVYAYSPFDQTTFERCNFTNTLVYANGTSAYTNCTFTGFPPDIRVLRGQIVSLRDCNFVQVDLGTSSNRSVVQASVSLDAVRCSFTDCRAYRAISAAATSLESCVIARHTGGQLILSSPLRMHNCLVADNDCGIGNTIIGNTELRVMGSTIVNNTGIAFLSDAPTRVLSNSIVRGNRRPGLTIPIESLQLGSFATGSTIDSCIVEGWTGTIPATNTSGVDPLFTDPLGPDTDPSTGDEDYRLATFSPAIDAGNAARLPGDQFDLDGDSDTAEPIPFDLAGSPRVVLASPLMGLPDPPSALDIGAYEYQADCNENGVFDLDEIDLGAALDCNANRIPDDCEPDCNGNGVPDDCDIASGASMDCNANDLPDECDIASGHSEDCNANGVPDECDPDCNGNSVPDDCDIVQGTSIDCNGNGIPDECDVFADCNGNGIDDACDIAASDAEDCNLDGIPDECRAEVQYMVDDGVAYANRNLALVYVGTPQYPTTTLILAQHTVVPGGETIHEVEFFGGSAHEKQLFIVVYADPNNDGDPGDATLIGAWPVAFPWTTYIGDAAYRTQSIPPTYVGEAGDSFFAGVWFFARTDDGGNYSFAGFVRSECQSARCFIDTNIAQHDLGSLAEEGILSLQWMEQHQPFTFWSCARPPGGPSPHAISMHIRPRTLNAYDCDLDLRPDECDAFPDINGNGVPDECECPGDVTGDGRVDVGDFVVLARGFGRTGAFWFDGDVTGDGAVTSADFCVLAATYGQVCKESAAPASGGGAVETFIWPAAMESPVDR